MKSAFLSLLLLLFCSAQLKSQELIKIPFGTTPEIDGVFNSDEWNDCGTTFLNILSGSDSIEIRYKHDSLNLHLVYMGHLESSGIRFPEVLLDIDNDKSEEWMDDDWWFHVSATDCEYQGEPANYDSCETVRPNWTASDNMTPGAPVTDTVEIQIPFETIGLDILTVDTIGISFEVTNTATFWEYWPQDADIDMPSTWGNAVFLDNTTAGLSENEFVNRVKVYPNPTTDFLQISGEINEFDLIEVFDLAGKSVMRQPFSTQISLNHLTPGTYLLNLSGDNYSEQHHVVIQ